MCQQITYPWPKPGLEQGRASQTVNGDDHLVQIGICGSAARLGSERVSRESCSNARAAAKVLRSVAW